MTTPQAIEFIPTSKLYFDPENPRFFQLNDPTSQEEVIGEMLDGEGVQDLMLSIGQKGYFAGEPLLIVQDKKKGFIVVEGNRRLAATKLLNNEIVPPKRRSASIRIIQEGAQHTPPTELPCIIYPSRHEVLRYLGYRHITGIKQWSPLAKAIYLEQLQNGFYADLKRLEQLKALANDIGSKPDYVGRLLTALKLYQHAEDRKFFGLRISTEDVEFSYITTAITYTKIVSWLGLENPQDIEMPKLNLDNLKDIFSWMFSKDQQGKTILGESRNLSDLARIVASKEATVVLKESGQLSEAFLFTEGPQEALSNAMGQADEHLRMIWNMLQKVRPISKPHVDFIDMLSERIHDVHRYIHDKYGEK